MKLYKPTINEWIMIVVFVLVAINGFYHIWQRDLYGWTS